MEIQVKLTAKDVFLYNWRFIQLTNFMAHNVFLTAILVFLFWITGVVAADSILYVAIGVYMAILVVSFLLFFITTIIIVLIGPLFKFYCKTTVTISEDMITTTRNKGTITVAHFNQISAVVITAHEIILKYSSYKMIVIKVSDPVMLGEVLIALRGLFARPGVKVH